MPMTRAYAALATSMILVGANVVILKILATHLPIFVILGLRSAFAALVLAPFAQPTRLPNRRIITNLALQAAFGTLAYNILLLAGLQRTGAVQAGLVLAGLPAIIALGAAILLRERLAPRQIVAIALAILGIAALAHGGGRFSAWGDLLVFGAVCGEATYALLARRAAGALPLVQATFWMQTASAAFCLPFMIPTLHQATFTPFITELLAIHSLTASLLALLLWYYGIRRVGAGIAAAFTLFLPATASLTAILFLGEQLTMGDALAMIALFTSIGLIALPHTRSASA